MAVACPTGKAPLHVCGPSFIQKPRYIWWTTMRSVLGSSGLYSMTFSAILMLSNWMFGMGHGPSWSKHVLEEVGGFMFESL